LLLSIASSRDWLAETNVCRQVYISGTQIPGAASSGRVNYVRWHIIFLSPQCGAYSMSHFWRLEFWTASHIFRKSASSWYEYAVRNTGASALNLLNFA
jgi:hypothetical protein